MHNRQSFVLYAEQQLNCLCGELFTSGYFYSGGPQIVLRRVRKGLRKFCLRCYKQVITLSSRRIKDKFSLVLSKFLQIDSICQFCKNFENMRENVSLIIHYVIWYALTCLSVEGHYRFPQTIWTSLSSINIYLYILISMLCFLFSCIQGLGATVNIS